MEKITDSADNFLKYGPLGFSALVFVAVLTLLLSGRGRGDGRILVLMVWITFGMFAISSVLAFVPQYVASQRPLPDTVVQKPMLTSGQSAEIKSAIKQADAAIEQVKSIVVMVSGSCPGGAHGVNPQNYGAVAAKANDAVTKITAASVGLRTALSAAAPTGG